MVPSPRYRREGWGEVVSSSFRNDRDAPRAVVQAKRLISRQRTSSWGLLSSAHAQPRCRAPRKIAGPRNTSSFCNDNLQILTRHDHSAVVGLVHTRDECVQVMLQIILPGFIERREGL